MNKTLKKVVSIVLLSALVLGILPVAAFAVGVKNKISPPFSLPSPIVYDESLLSGDSDDTNDGNDDLNTAPEAEDSTHDEQEQEKLRYPELEQQIDTYEELYGEPVYVAEYERIYQTGELDFLSVFSPVPNTYISEEGLEELIDNTLILDSESHTFENSSNSMEVEIPAELNINNGISISYEQYTMQLIPLEGTYTKAVASENAIRYNNVFEGIDVQYTVLEYLVKEDIILLYPPDIYSFSYLIESPGLFPVIDDEIVYLIDGENRKIFNVMAPVMYDALNEMSYDIKMTLKDNILTFSVNPEWLNSPERVYPVKIDPTVINTTVAQASGMFSPAQSRFEQAVGHLATGFCPDTWIGYPTVPDSHHIRGFIYFNNIFSSFTEDFEIDSATLKLYKYQGSSGSNDFEIYRLNANRSFSALQNYFNNVSTSYWEEFVMPTPRSYIASFGGPNGRFYSIDITETVNNWQKGVFRNYGLGLWPSNNASNYYGISGRFCAHGGETEYLPAVEIRWHLLGDVPDDYPLDDLTVELRAINVTDLSGKMDFIGATWDGVGKPHGEVDYELNDLLKGFDETTHTDNDYLYPDTSVYEAGLPSGATRYRRRISNWQTILPFVEHDFNTLYYLDATVTVNGNTSVTKTSDTYIVYKATQFDTLPNIANHYGVSYDQVARDNHVVDRLIVENNTVFIRNPTKNQDVPYNPPELTDAMKWEIDMLLMGRGLHCEFNFEPVNMNTGNFYYNITDASVPDYSGMFYLERSYNSKGAAINSVFGIGWSFSFDEHLSSLEDGTIIYKRSDGSAVWFYPDGSGGYTTSGGIYLTLTKVSDGVRTRDFGIDENGATDIPVFKYTVTEINGSIRVFNGWGMPEEIIDPNGFSTVITYDAKHRLKSIETSSGYIFGITIDDEGRIVKITLPDGNELGYVYDGYGNLITFIDALGGRIRYTYDTKHRMISWYDQNGAKMIENTYDDENRVVKQLDGNNNPSLLLYTDNKTVATDANGNISVYCYDDQYRTVKVEYPDGTRTERNYNLQNEVGYEIDRLGNRTEFIYDLNGNILRRTRFDGLSMVFTYNGRGDVTSFTDFDGKLTVFPYDSSFNLLNRTFNDNSSESYTYNSKHQVETSSDAMGNVTHYVWSGALLLALTDAKGNIYSFGYDGMGRLTSIIDPNGGTSGTVYDASGRTIKTFNANGETTEYSYDSAGRVRFLTDPMGFVTEFTYDNMDNVLTLTDDDGNVYRFGYDKLNNKVYEEDPVGNTMSFKYDSMSRLIEKADGDGGITKFSYDSIDNILELTAANGGIMKFTYDYRTNRASSVIDPMGNVTELEYNEVGLPLKQTFPDGSFSVFLYDNRNRLLRYTDTLGLITEYEYDLNGNIVKVSDSTSRETYYEYDALNLLVKTVLPNGGILEYSYDSLKRLSSVIDVLNNTASLNYTATGQISLMRNQNGDTVGFNYDANGNISGITDGNGNTYSSIYTSFNSPSVTQDAAGAQTKYDYDDAGRLSAVHDALGNTTRYSSNGRSIPTEITDALGGVYTLAYDEIGNITSVTLPDGAKTVYVYDLNGRLTSTENANGLITNYEYDRMGNIVKEYDNEGTDNRYTFNSVGLPLTITDALNRVTVLTYDILGNLISMTGYDGNLTEFTYDSMNNLIKVTDAENRVTEYIYDLAGNLTKTTDAAARDWQYTYDKIGQLISMRDPLGGVSGFSYDANGNISNAGDANGYTIVFEYDPMNRLSKYTDANSNSYSYIYDALGNLFEVTAPDGGTHQYRYDALSRLSEYRDPMGYLSSYSYDSVGNLISNTMPNGGAYKYTYDSVGLLKTTEDPFGNISSTTRDLLGRVTEYAQPNGARYTYDYDAVGRITGVKGPEERSINYSYDRYGNLKDETDAKGSITSYGYDIMHRLTSVTDAKGGITEFTYDLQNNVNSITTPLGAVHQYIYDELDRLIAFTDPTGRSSSYKYDAIGNLTEVILPGNRKTEYSYDPMGNVTGITDALSNNTLLNYDVMNRVIGFTDTMGRTTMFGYDLVGNLIEVTDTLGGITEYGYDSNRNLTKYTDAENRVTSFSYDLMNRLVSVTDGTGAEVNYVYDSVGNLTEVTDPNGNTTVYGYNLLGELVSLTSPLGHTQSYIYDKAGNLVSSLSPSGKKIDYDYDALNELVKKDYNGKEPNTDYTYDADGRLVAMKDVTGTSSYTYDAAGRLLTAKNGHGDTVGYGYNDAGEISSITYPDGKVVYYIYDDLGRLTEVTGRDGKKTVYTYDAAGNVIRVVRGDNSITESIYDALNRLITLINYAGGIIVSTFCYEYDATGFITKETAELEGKRTVRTFGYNERGELITVNEQSPYGNNTIRYTYDAAGNRIKQQDNTGTVIYVYNEAGQLTSTSGKEASVYVYDKDGNLIAKTGDGKHYKYEYTAENRLKAVREGGTILMTALYDGLGDRAFSSRQVLISVKEITENQLPGYWVYLRKAEEDQAEQQVLKPQWKKESPTTPEPSEDSTDTSDSLDLTMPKTEEERLFWYGFSLSSIRLMTGDETLAGRFISWWNEFWSLRKVYSLEVQTELANMGYTFEDQKMLLSSGFTESDAKDLIKVWKKGAVITEEKDVIIPVMDTIYYVNDITALNTTVLSSTSKYGFSSNTYTYGNELITTEHKGKALTALYDGRGSIVQRLTNSSVSSTYTYDPYGVVTSKIADVRKPFYGYNGEEYDPLTKLQYLRARYYSPSEGRFTSQDSYKGTVTSILSQNGYTYVHNNPVNFIDPSGHFTYSLSTLTKYVPFLSNVFNILNLSLYSYDERLAMVDLLIVKGYIWELEMMSQGKGGLVSTAARNQMQDLLARNFTRQVTRTSPYDFAPRIEDELVYLTDAQKAILGGIKANDYDYVLKQMCGVDSLLKMTDIEKMWVIERFMRTFCADYLERVAAGEIPTAETIKNEILDAWKSLNYIYGQGNAPNDSIQLGISNISNAGCGPVAVYNMLISLGLYMSLVDIVKYYSLNGGLTLGGLLGTNSWTAAQFLREQGISVDYHYSPIKYDPFENTECNNDPNNPLQPYVYLDNTIKNAGRAIVQYSYTGPLGGHYIAIEYDRDIDMFIIYNTSWKKDESKQVSSLLEFLESQDMLTIMSYILVG